MFLFRSKVYINVYKLSVWVYIGEKIMGFINLPNLTANAERINQRRQELARQAAELATQSVEETNASTQNNQPSQEAIISAQDRTLDMQMAELNKASILVKANLAKLFS